MNTAAAIAATIKQNVTGLMTGRIDFDEFDRRQRAAWDTVTGRPDIRDEVLDILNPRLNPVVDIIRATGADHA